MGYKNVICVTDYLFGVEQKILVIQSEVSQKEKHQYSILTHIYGI